MGLAVVHTALPPPRDRRHDIRKIVEELHRQNPRSGEERLSEMLAERIEEDRHLLLDAARALVRQLFTTLATARQKSSPHRAERRAEEKAEVQQLAAKVREIAVLDMLMPNGQHLRFCTGSEVAAFGAGFVKLAERVPADALVGEIVTEAEAAALMRAA